MIVSLPMYDLPPLQAANDRYWRTIREHLGEGPEALTRQGDLWDHWLSPDLLLSQTCGYPFRSLLHDKVTLIGTPDYGLPGCAPGFYCSVFVARADDPRDAPGEFASARFAFNEPVSQSGWAAPQHHARLSGFSFDTVVQTGAHRASALAVRDGKADIAAIDALTWIFLCRHERFAGDLKEIDRTLPTPTLPYITAKGRDGHALFAAISSAIGALDSADRDMLCLRGLVAIPAGQYLDVPTPPAPQMT